MVDVTLLKYSQDSTKPRSPNGLIEQDSPTVSENLESLSTKPESPIVSADPELTISKNPGPLLTLPEAPIAATEPESSIIATKPESPTNMTEPESSTIATEPTSPNDAAHYSPPHLCSENMAVQPSLSPKANIRLRSPHHRQTKSSRASRLPQEKKEDGQQYIRSKRFSSTQTDYEVEVTSIRALSWALFTYYVFAEDGHTPERLDFAYLVKMQAEISDTFADAINQLNSPVVLYSDAENGDNPHGIDPVKAKRGRPSHAIMKLAELAVIDMRVAARHSKFSEEAKQVLDEYLGDFHESAHVYAKKLLALKTRSNRVINSQIVTNVFLSNELDRLENLAKGVSGSLRQLAPSFPLIDRIFEISSMSDSLGALYSKTLLEGRSQLRMLRLEVQEIQGGLNHMEQLRQTILNAIEGERTHQEKKLEDVMPYIWTQLLGHRCEQETYLKNLELLKAMDDRQRLTRDQLPWVQQKLDAFEREMDMLWEQMTESSFAWMDDGSQDENINSKKLAPDGNPLKKKKASNFKKKMYTFHGDIHEIKNLNKKLKEQRDHAQAMFRE
ncbi:hypothetical protein FBU30_005800 [Linnemannia zychae]|nr:hypothetical protein FBU30_005800 [Linnemannia zychae]